MASISAKSNFRMDKVVIGSMGSIYVRFLTEEGLGRYELTIEDLGIEGWGVASMGFRLPKKFTMALYRHYILSGVTPTPWNEPG